METFADYTISFMFLDLPDLSHIYIYERLRSRALIISFEFHFIVYSILLLQFCELLNALQFLCEPKKN